MSYLWIIFLIALLTLIVLPMIISIWIYNTTCILLLWSIKLRAFIILKWTYISFIAIHEWKCKYTQIIYYLITLIDWNTLLFCITPYTMKSTITTLLIISIFTIKPTFALIRFVNAFSILTIMTIFFIQIFTINWWWLHLVAFILWCFIITIMIQVQTILSVSSHIILTLSEENTCIVVYSTFLWCHTIINPQ